MRRYLLTAAVGVAVLLVVGLLITLSVTFEFTAAVNIALFGAVATAAGASGSVTAALLAYKAAGRSNDAVEELRALGERSAEALFRGLVHEHEVGVTLGVTAGGPEWGSPVPWRGIWVCVSNTGVVDLSAEVQDKAGLTMGRVGPEGTPGATALRSGRTDAAPASDWFAVAVDRGSELDALSVDDLRELVGRVVVSYADPSRVGRWRQVFAEWDGPQRAPAPTVIGGRLEVSAEVRRWAHLRPALAQWAGTANVRNHGSRINRA